MNLPNIIESWNNLEVLVVGDVMLDQYTETRATRVSPEAPVPVLIKTGERAAVGGAGNVASTLSALGARVTVISVIGDDAHGRQLSQLLQDARVSAQLVPDASRPTITKARVVAGSNFQQLLRIDTETTTPVSGVVEARCQLAIREQISRAKVVLIADYAKGFCTERIIREVVDRARAFGIPVTADIKTLKHDMYRGVSLVTPNLKEAELLTGTADEVRAAEILSLKLDSDVCVTLSERGLFYHGKDGSTARETVVERTPADVSGAGDAVHAVLALALGVSAPVEARARLANAAGAAAVRTHGTNPVSRVDLLESLKRQARARGGSGSAADLIDVLDTVLASDFKEKVDTVARVCYTALVGGNKLLVAGNGGSAAEADHFVAEIVGRYKMERRGYPAITLPASSATMSALGNDYGYEQVFSRQVEALGITGDILFLLTTSGKSKNLITAAEMARSKGITVFGLLGNGGGELLSHTDISYVVESGSTARIQEVHLLFIHSLCEKIDELLHAHTP